jgi:hypothetical protein
MLAAVVLLSAGAALAQDLPRENHYKVYHTIPYTVAKPLLLTDQFGSFDANAFLLERFANPAEKRVGADIYPIVDPLVHLTWWRITPPPAQPPKSIIGIDQFGIAPWTLYDPVYLLNPSLKNVTGNPPIWNHYVCYQAVGPDPGRLVVLADQFGGSEVFVLRAEYFCNPVEKRHLDDGRVYPVIDYKAHLACYMMTDTNPMAHPVMAVDQFGNWIFDAFQPDCLCLPALKEHVVRTEESTWGKIKALYN